MRYYFTRYCTRWWIIEGKVVAASDGMYSATGTMIPLVVSEGDTVLYNKNAHKSEHRLMVKKLIF